MSVTAIFYKIEEEAVIPSYATEDSAGCDLNILGDYKLEPGSINLLRTGIIAKPPFGYHWELCLRSSFPCKYPGLVLANGIGIIDSDFIGPQDEIKIPILNASWFVYNILHKSRIAQLILRHNLKPHIKEKKIEENDSNVRGGFGSTFSVTP